jgi:phosphatidylglycerol:prolipoprotein diacylglycerol transferase
VAVVTNNPEKEPACAGPAAPVRRNWVVLARLGPLTLVNFGLFVAAGGMAAGLLTVARLDQAGFRLDAPLWLEAVGLPLLILVGSRLLEIGVHWRAYAAAPARKLPETGFAFQGGLLLGAAVLLGCAWATGLAILRVFDAFALSIPLGHAIGRIGCLTYGCCHGRPTGTSGGITYENPEAKAVWKEALGGVPLHPTQLYASAGNLLAFALLSLLAAAGPWREGTLSAAYLLGGSAGRFGLDFLRWPPADPSRLLKPFQRVSLALFAGGLVVLLASGSRPEADFTSWARLAEGLGRASAHVSEAAVAGLVLFAGFGIHGRRVGRYHGA